jgi:hypothetical protein
MKRQEFLLPAERVKRGYIGLNEVAGSVGIDKVRVVRGGAGDGVILG